MKRAAGRSAIAALVVGLLGMGWWLWPLLQFRAPQTTALAAMPAAALQTQVLAWEAPGHAPPTVKDPSLVADGGACNSWFATIPVALPRVVMEPLILAARTRGEARLNQLLAQIAQAGSPNERAAALYLKVLGQAKQVSLNFHDRNPECRNGTECSVDVGAAVGVTTDADVNVIARMASASHDPQLYGLAFQACHRVTSGQPPGECTNISAEQWAQRDPGNGTAWLYVADRAANEGRESDKAEAIYRFTQTTRFDLGLSLLSELMRHEALSGDTLFVASTATDWTFQARTQAPLAGYQVVIAHCTLATLRDTNRAQLCNGVANRLLGDNSALLGPALGFGLGERLAWPAERLAAIKEELNALRAVAGETMELLYGDAKLTADEDPIAQGRAGCEAMNRSTAFLNTQLRVGEVQELRGRLANHTLSRAALAAQYAATVAAAQHASEHPPAKR